MNFLKEIFQKDIVKRLIVLIIIIIFLYILRPMLNLLLLTFLFTYIAYSMQTGITKKLDKVIEIKPIVIIIIKKLAKRK
jgi:hypothetical protein